VRSSPRVRAAAVLLAAAAASCAVLAPDAARAPEGATGAPNAGASSALADAGAAGTASDAGLVGVLGDASSPAVVIPPSPPGTAATLIHRVTPSRLLPEVLTGPRGLVAVEDGARRMLLDRMRLFVRADGSLERAMELLPLGSVTSVALPSRLGGGYLFYANQGRGTEMWRAESWLDRLVPVTRVSEVVGDVVPGFDRLYLRLNSGNRVTAVDPRDGHAMGLGPLPVASGYGLLAFADGWRGVVDTDLRGPLTTFDAGATWRAVSVQERVLGVGVVDGNPTVLVNGGGYVIDPRGGVTLRPDAPPRARGADEDDSRGRDLVEALRASPLGKRPLRAAVEDGWPDTTTTAVVARGGALARVSLTDGRVLAVAEDAYPEHRASCHAVRLGLHDVGFLCGERDGPTTVYAFAPPLAMKPVLRFEKPRFVAASGNGALVIRGRCAPDESQAKSEDESDARWYCVRTPTGETREIRVKGFDLGVERVVGLGDGRVAVLVPPRGATPGALSIITGGSAATVPLELPTSSAGRELRRGLWLEGFEERRPGVLGGWVEAGGPSVGIEIGLDGKVKAGELREDALGAIYGGRFAMSLGDGGRAFETSDGGMSWAELTLPERDEEARQIPSRGCGPVGCALPGWVRVGWGEPQDPTDMKEAKSPTAPYPPIKMPPTFHFDCSVASVSTPPAPDKPVVPPPARARGAPAVFHPPRPSQHETSWARFRNVDGPALAADEYGVDNGSGPSDAIALRAYAWGKLGSDWSRGARWLVRYDDRFDPAGGVRASALTASLWSQLADATDAIGTNPYSTSWKGFLDPSGHSLLASTCSRAICSMYSVGDGQPVLPLRGPLGTVMRPYDNAAVRVGEAWFFLTATPSYDGLQLWRAELGAARPIAAYHRVFQRNSYDQPRLVRRAVGSGVGILIAGSAEPGEKTGNWFVLPIDPDTGALGEAITLGRRDYAGINLARCAPGQDGWTFDVSPTPDANTNVELSNARARFDTVELRVRLDPGRACIEALAVRSEAFFALETKPAQPGPARPLTTVPARGAKGATSQEGAIPMAATEKQTGRRWGLQCKIRR
jgi:hypothetical protein